MRPLSDGKASPRERAIGREWQEKRASMNAFVRSLMSVSIPGGLATGHAFLAAALGQNLGSVVMP